MKCHQARLAELALANLDHCVLQIYIVALQLQRLTGPHSCAGKQSQDRDDCLGPESILGNKLMRCLHQFRDFVAIVNVRLGTMMSWSQQTAWRDMRSRLDSCLILGKACDRFQTFRLVEH